MAVSVIRAQGRDYPFQVFDLGSLGIPADEFTAFFRPTFYTLQWDYYDVRLRHIRFLQKCLPADTKALECLLPSYYETGIRPALMESFLAGLSRDQRREFDAIAPFRQRSATNLGISFFGSDCLIEILRPRHYCQSACDYRAMPRLFQAASPEVLGHSLFKTLVVAVAQMARSVLGCAAMELVMHQISVIATGQQVGLPVPEGIHQDGARAIVSAIVCDLENVTGGESVVFSPYLIIVNSDPVVGFVKAETQEIFRQRLGVGQGIFMDDLHLWHYATPVKCVPPAASGRRSIIGFDIHCR